MINLAGVAPLQAETMIYTELTLAGIPLYWPLDDKQRNPEVYVNSFGRLGDWTFRRYWYYWVALAPDDKGLSLEEANKLHADPLGQKEVRAGGDCACRPPEIWANYFDADGRELCSDPDGTQERNYKELVAKGLLREYAGRFVKDKREGYARAVVSGYHIDSQAGLAMFAKILFRLGAVAGPGGNSR